MIRINLLPFREAKKRENIRRQISVYVLSVVFLFLVMGYLFLTLTSELRGLRAEKMRKEKELASYEETVKRIEALKERTEELRTKLGVIRELEKHKTGPVQLLDEIATAVPKGQLWLRSLEEKRGLLTLTGTAMDNDTVALYMRNLEKGEHIKEVDLKSTQLRALTEFDVDVTEFILTCKTYAYKEPEPVRKKGRKKKGRKRKKK